MSGGEMIEGFEQPKPCCVELRCKTLTYRADERPGLIHHSDAMTYWCAQTGTDDGPDDAVVDHASCQAPRTCFQGVSIA